MGTWFLILNGLLSVAAGIAAYLDGADVGYRPRKPINLDALRPPSQRSRAERLRALDLPPISDEDAGPADPPPLTVTHSKIATGPDTPSESVTTERWPLANGWTVLKARAWDGTLISRRLLDEQGNEVAAPLGSRPQWVETIADGERFRQVSRPRPYEPVEAARALPDVPATQTRIVKGTGQELSAAGYVKVYGHPIWRHPDTGELAFVDDRPPLAPGGAMPKPARRTLALLEADEPWPDRHPRLYRRLPWWLRRRIINRYLADQ